MHTYLKFEKNRLLMIINLNYNKKNQYLKIALN